MLQSAVGYLQQDGVTVQAQNLPHGLALTVPGAFYSLSDNGTSATFHIGTPPHAERNGTPEAERTGTPEAERTGTPEAAVPAPSGG